MTSAPISIPGCACGFRAVLAEYDISLPDTAPTDGARTLSESCNAPVQGPRRAVRATDGMIQRETLRIYICDKQYLACELSIIFK